jgi:hypothetical protein
MMEIVRLTSRRLLMLAALAISAAVVITAVAQMSSASARSSIRGSAASGPPKTVTASLIKRRPHTLKPGTAVRSSVLGQRVFVSARDGFALANTGGAQYPAATTDGGQTWKTDGPALHIDAAQAPLVVTDIGAASKRTVFAFGGGQVVDATGDGGKHWWGAILGSGVLAAVPRLGGGLIAVAQNPGSGGSGAQTLIYVSRDGGHHWHLSTKFGT